MGQEERKMNAEVEVIEVKVKKTQSEDREYRVVLATDDPAVLNLQKYISEKTVVITWEGNTPQT